jgi:dipeptidase
MDTEVSVVMQSRGWLPADIGAICWRAMATPCTSIFTPWYLGSTQIPKEYRIGISQFTDNSAYWTARNLSKSADMRYGGAVEGEIRKTIHEFEQAEFDFRKAIEDRAMELYRVSPDKARVYLTQYSSGMAKKAMEKMKHLYDYTEKN